MKVRRSESRRPEGRKSKIITSNSLIKRPSIIDLRSSGLQPLDFSKLNYSTFNISRILPFRIGLIFIIKFIIIVIISAIIISAFTRDEAIQDHAYYIGISFMKLAQCML